MNCAAFEAWLDEGAPAAAEPEARAHMRECARCASTFEAERRIRASFVAAAAAPPPAAPAAFTDHVMARVAELERTRRLASAPGQTRTTRALDTSSLPWWAEVPAEPAAALALLVAALVAWQAQAWLANGPAAVVRTGLWLDGIRSLVAARTGGGLSPEAVQALALGLLPAMVLLAIPLYRLGLRAAAGRPRIHTAA